MDMFTVVTTLSSIGFIFVWAIILLAYLKYRQTRPQLHERSIYKLPGGVPMAWVCLAFLAFVLVLFSRDEDTRLGLMCMPLWFGACAVLYWTLYHRKHRDKQVQQQEPQLPQ